MATILLQAAGAFLGGVLGPVGMAIGSAAGALAGYVIDRAIINSTQHHEGPRLTGARPFTAEEGASLPRVYGTMRVGGTMIWATRFEEERRTERQGAKGGPRVTTYSYFANVAFALCEGEVAGVRRVWADGRELDLDRVELRTYRGTETQAIDPLVGARQGTGNAPAYRGTAYVVLERFPLGDYGNRIPQFQFEVMRPVGSLNDRIRAVAMIPGSTEYGLSPTVVTRTLSPGETRAENRHVLHGSSDFATSLDELLALCPNLEHVGLVVAWFGDDLRAGHCTIRPKVTHQDTAGLSQPWLVSGDARDAASLVSSFEGGAAYGGTPSDRSVIDAIVELKARGLKVTLHPFVMMDVAHGNTLPDPYSDAGSQPPYPWRGRITCDPAPGLPATADKTAAARSQIDAFCGAAQPEAFSATASTVLFAGDTEDWGFRRFVLHHASLAAAAGGVDAFLLGSELRGLTTLRDGAGAFPFVEALCALADDVRSIVGSSCSITYGADWTEYFGHQPGDGSGDVFFHLDPLWAHEEIGAVGIDNYMPLADWRDGDAGGGNPDGLATPYDIEGLGQAIAAGEGFDWYYASAADRLARERTPITDGAYGKPWVFRYKDLVGWWSSHHHDRPDGVEDAEPTAWIPRGKPIWFTELGCPAVDKGPNQPNVFPDPKSSENAAPHFSNGGRSDAAPYSLISAHLDRWDAAGANFSEAGNPVSDQYAGRMVDASRIYLWSWDARPFPAFPARGDVWGDGQNWLLGHWLNGRMNGVDLAALINAILADHGCPPADVRDVTGALQGFLVADPGSARAALEPIVDLFGLTVREGPDGLVFSGGDTTRNDAVEIDEFVLDGDRAALTRIRTADHEMPAEIVLGFADPMQEFQSATARALLSGVAHGGQRTLGFPGAMEPAMAEALLQDWVRRRWTGREQARFAVPQGRIEIGPGSTVRLPQQDGGADYLVTGVDSGIAREITARRLNRVAPAPWRTGLAPAKPARVPRVGPPFVALVDLPMIAGVEHAEDQLRLAVRAKPWIAHASFVSPVTSGYERRGLVAQQAIMGVLAAGIGPGFEGRYDRAGTIEVDLYSGELSSVSEAQLLNGANAAAILAQNGEWELVQFAEAEEIAPSRWRLRHLLRAQAATRPASLAGAAEGAIFVMLDGAVLPAGLRRAEIGLPLNWRVGPLGHDFAGSAYWSGTVTGGLRAMRPLSPVHARAARRGDGGYDLSWIRRSRIASNAAITATVPLGEETELYGIDVMSGATLVRQATVATSGWTYEAAALADDFPDLPAAATITVRQISAAVGAGDPAIIEIHIS